jgi:hypothetical protein
VVGNITLAKMFFCLFNFCPPYEGASALNFTQSNLQDQYDHYSTLEYPGYKINKTHLLTITN